jgi:hypothetical protein
MHDLCTAPNITGVVKSRMTKWAGRMSSMAQARNACGFFLVVKREGKSPFVSRKRRWHDVKIVLY